MTWRLAVLLLCGAISSSILPMLCAPALGQVPQGKYPPPGNTALTPNQPPMRPLVAPALPHTNPVQQQPPAANPLDAPLHLIYEAARSFQGVRDYQCTFIKQEQINRQLQPENVIAMRVRNQPFSVYLRWIAPKGSVGQEVCYVAGKNNDKMRVHSPGALGMFGFHSIDVKDPRALATSRHQITEAGIGNLIERFRRTWEVERQWNRTQVRIADYEYNKRPCARVETIHPDRMNGQMASYRTVIYFDKETRLPIRLESYDWPVPGGPRDGALEEMYSYVDLRFNIGLTDDSFRY